MIVRRGLTVQRWRVSTHLRIFNGHGLANFEFEFRFGFPRHSPRLVRDIASSFGDPDVDIPYEDPGEDITDMSFDGPPTPGTGLEFSDWKPTIPAPGSVESRGVGLWHKRRTDDGVLRFYRWLRFVGYVRCPRAITPWRSGA